MAFTEELESIFDDSFEKQTQEALMKCLFSAYGGSYEKCYKEFPKEEAHDLLPFYRWIRLRTELRGLEGRFGEIETTSEPNGPAPSYHLVVKTNRVILTVSSVDGPRSLPRPALYRIEYANTHQLDLFKPVENSKVYAILIHGPKQGDKRQPGFAQIGFPAKGFEYYIHRIDLFSKFNALVKSLSGQSEEVAKTTLKELTPQIIKKAE
jgi:hypothetical protein